MAFIIQKNIYQNLLLFLIFGLLLFPGQVGSENPKEEQLKIVIEKGNQYSREGKFQEALREWEKGLELDPGNGPLLTLITITKVQIKDERDAQIKMGMKYFFSDPSKSLQAWNRVLEIEPGNKEAKLNAERLRKVLDDRIEKLSSEVEERLQKKEFLYARDTVKEIMKLDPNSGIGERLIEKIKKEYLFELKQKIKMAQRYYYTGKYKNTIEILGGLVGEKLLDPLQDLPDLYMFLGYAYGALGDWEKARLNFKSALNFNPQIPVAKDVPINVQNIFNKIKKEGEEQ